ncbi:MAG: DNA polymerase I [Ignavibacteria bacterium]|jgi:DNA polymerase-1|nr:DNA polymerase I [Ignavibacteria bacterium]
MRKLYLIDGMSVAFRAYHAFGDTPLTNKDGLPTGAILGFANIITGFIEKEKPDNIAVCFDCRQPTFRHQLYPEYKANRKAFPEDLGVQLPYIKRFIELIGIRNIEMPGFEADDIIGTISHIASGDMQVYCLTSDKDFFQLLNDNVFLLRNKKGSTDFEVIGVNDVKERFGVRALQVVDYLALIGDTSDNIPGVKGIGEKSAIPLIEDYNTLENVYDNLDKIEKARTRKLLQEGKDSAFLSKTLVTIKTDIELPFEIDDLMRTDINTAELDALFKELGFTQLRKKWKTFPIKNELSMGDNLFPQYDVVEESEVGDILQENTAEFVLVDMMNINTMLADIGNLPYLSVCVETDTADRNTNQIVGISFCNSEDKAYYLPFKKIEAESEPAITDLLAEYILSDIQWILEEPTIMKFGYNLKSAAYALKKHGITLSPISFDASVGEFLIDNTSDLTMQHLARKYLHTAMPSANSKSEFSDLADMSIADKCNYFCNIANNVFKLRSILANKLSEDNIFFVAESIEFPLVEILTDMEFTGIAVDTNVLEELGYEINKEIVRLKQFIFNETNVEFNIDSPKQLADVLFNKLGLHPSKKNKTGYSTDLETLTELAQTKPVADLILNYRKYSKIKNTYIDALPKQINEKTQRVHTTFNQNVVSTGRLSSSDPNLQNIPIRTEIGKEIRAAFIARNADYMLVSADYSQIELRIMAFASNDANLISAFKNNLDIHSATASLLFNRDVADVTDDMRRTAKTVNFGIIYGLGSYGLSQRLQITRSAADGIIHGYFEKFPGIRQYITETLDKVRRLGFAETMTGRRRYFQDINHRNFNIRSAAERAAINMPIQGTASDMIKIAMINIYQILKQQGSNSKMLLQVHDELLFEVPIEEVDIVSNIVNTQMIYALPLGDIPLAITLGAGRNWLEAHP